MTTRIAPSILAADFARLADAVALVESAGADLLHIDVMDGHFVPNITVGPPVVAALRRVTRLPLDVHLMITDPDRYLEAFASAGASALTVHAEVVPHLHRTLTRIRELGLLSGVAFNPSTPVHALAELDGLVDQVLIMSVNPGFGGQSFIPRSIAKVAEARALLNRSGSQAAIEVDGGVDTDNARALVEAGTTVLVAGAFIYGAKDPAGAIADLRRAAAGAA